MNTEETIFVCAVAGLIIFCVVVTGCMVIELCRGTWEPVDELIEDGIPNYDASVPYMPEQHSLAANPNFETDW